MIPRLLPRCPPAGGGRLRVRPISASEPGTVLARDGNHASTLGRNWLHNFDLLLREEGTFVEVFFEMGRVIRFVLVNQTTPGVGDYELVSLGAAGVVVWFK